MNVMVTGAAGFIGSNFIHFLCAERPTWKITALDLLTYAGNLENIDGPLKGKNVRFVRADIADAASMQKVFREEKYDLVFHLAAETHVDRSILGAQAFVRTNALGTQVLLDCARETNVQRFVHISTDEVYGSLGPTGRFYETTPLDPSSPYSASKAASDLLVLAYCRTHNFNASITRCTNNYGPYQFPEKVIPLFVSNAMDNKKLPLYGDGMNVRSWLYVDDHSDAILRVGEKGKAGEVYNIGGSSEAEIPNRVLTETILKLLGKPQSLIEMVADRPGHDRRYAVSTEKIENELGWKARIPFEEGMRKTIQWYQANEAWWRKIKSGEYLEYYERNYAQR